MSELYPITAIVAVCTLLWGWYLVSYHQAIKNWQPVDANYEIVGSTVPSRDIIHGVFYLRLVYFYNGHEFTKLITLNYNRHTLNHYMFNNDGLHSGTNMIHILVNPNKPHLILYQKVPLWNHLLALSVFIILWSCISYGYVKLK